MGRPSEWENGKNTLKEPVDRVSAKSNNSTSIAIRQVLVEDLDRGIPGLEDFQHCLVVFRFKGAVVGTAWFPVVNGEVSPIRLQSVVSEIAWPVWQQIIAQMEASPPPRITTATVVVCTRNRASDLASGLPALAKLVEQGHQVLVVDNCPSDDSTSQLVAKYPGIIYIYEPRAGLDIARNRGLREATGEVAVFIDDDAVPDAGWLDALLLDFDDPMVAVVTGITLPLELDTQAQSWFEKTNGFARGFTRRVFDSAMMSVVGTGQVGAGVNMAIRCSALGEIGLFDEALDGGTMTLSGGDQEFYYRTLARGYRIVYEPKALVWHKHRREWEALRHTIFGYGVGLYAWWTKTLIVQKELTLLYWGTVWFCQHILGNLMRSLLRRSGCVPLDLAWAELWGAVIGPFRYLRSSRALNRQIRQSPAVGGLTKDWGQAPPDVTITNSNSPAGEVPISGIQGRVEVQ